MAFLKGQEIYSADSKGRVNIPSKMRKSLSLDANNTFTVTRGVDNCIAAYPLDEWRKYEGQFEKLNHYDPQNRYFLRTVLMWSEEVVLDGQQRIQLPKKLLEFAQIENKVIIVGMGDHIEFWNPVEFEKYLNNHDEPYEVVASKVMTKDNE